MKLLILTQKIDKNDDVLGFMHAWISEFANQTEAVMVICLQKGEYNFLSNIKVLSLGKETGRSKLKYFYKFYRYIWQERKKYDVVFVHMNYEYIILGGILWHLWKKKIVLWYAHGFVPVGLKLAERLVDVIFTSTKSGCRVNSPKIQVIGQGIDINFFRPSNTIKDRDNKAFSILTIGRISPVKDYLTLIKAAEILHKKNIKVRVDIVGKPVISQDNDYLRLLKNIINEKGLSGIFNFKGGVPNKEILSYLQVADIFVNMSHTGSLDKAVLEAMACAVPILTCNEAFSEVLGKYEDRLMYSKNNFQELADKIAYIYKLNIEQRTAIGRDLREIVIKNHALNCLIQKILDIIK